jgi:hypothetical protein
MVSPPIRSNGMEFMTVILTLFITEYNFWLEDIQVFFFHSFPIPYMHKVWISLKKELISWEDNKPRPPQASLMLLNLSHNAAMVWYAHQRFSKLTIMRNIKILMNFLMIY